MEDVDALEQLLDRCHLADGDEEERLSVDEIRHLYFGAPGADPSRDSIGVFELDGTLVAYGWTYSPPDPVREARSEQYGIVDPRFRRRGIGRRILAWTEERGRERIAATPEELPGILETWALDRLEDRQALFRAAGFEPMRYFTTMERPLDQPVEPAPLPANLEITTWREELDEAVREAHNDAFRDHWGFEPRSTEQWRFHYAASERFLPDLSYLALDGRKVVGYVMSAAMEQDRVAPGGPQAWLGTIGVIRGYRKSGVASGLMTRTMEAFRRSGFRKAVLDVDTENPTGALGLYERHGFRSIRRFILQGRTIRHGRDQGPPLKD